MSYDADKLYQLLPAVYRIRDSERDEVLKAFLAVLAGQADVVEEDIAQLYDNWFIETCDEWVVPYIGNLLGVRNLHPINDKADFSQRARVANTLGYRRRKGTATMLEQLAHDTTGWDARVVEFFQLLDTTQYFNHIRLYNYRSPDIRDGEKLELLDTPFDTIAHTGEVRHIDNGRGKYNIPNIGIFLWRLQAFPVNDAPAFPHNYFFSWDKIPGNDNGILVNFLEQNYNIKWVSTANIAKTDENNITISDGANSLSLKLNDEKTEVSLEIDANTTDIFIAKMENSKLNIYYNNGRFSFSQLGNDIPLFNLPVTEKKITYFAEEVNVPTPIRRRAFYHSKESYYGEDKSFFIRADGVDITPDKVVPCDLSDWKHRPPDGMVAVDPLLGRIAFSDGVLPSDVQVYYHYGFSSEVGGGFYDRRADAVNVPNAKYYEIGKSLGIMTVKDAISSWVTDGRHDAVFLIKDSQVYDETLPLNFTIPPGITLEIKADNEERPVIRLTDPITIKGETAVKDQPGGGMIIDGLLIAGNGIIIKDGDLGSLQILHTTLVPGLDLNADGTPKSAGDESLTVEKNNLRLETKITRSITGSLDLRGTDLLSIRDSIIDGLEGSAIKGPSVAIEESTIMGTVSVKSVRLGSNSIFTGTVIAERKQEGCMRFSYFPKDSKVPRQYHCQPDTAIQKAVQDGMAAALSKKPGMSPKEQEQTETKLRQRFEKEIPPWLKPCFTDLHYGHPAYAQLCQQCPVEILEGAEDEAEMGVFHHLQQPQREKNLIASLEEYMRVGLEAGIFYVT